MKLRIKKTTFKNDSVSYYPQFRNFLGVWCYFKELIYEADGYYIHGFSTLEEAEGFLIKETDLYLGGIEEKTEYYTY